MQPGRWVGRFCKFCPLSANQQSSPSLVNPNDIICIISVCGSLRHVASEREGGGNKEGLIYREGLLHATAVCSG